MTRKRNEDEALEKVLPHNLEAERSVLGVCLLAGERLIEVIDELRPEDFFRSAHRAVYRALMHLHERQVATDMITVRDRLQQTGELDEVGPAYIAKLVDGCPRSTNIEHYAAIIRRDAIRRDAIRVGHQLIADAQSGEDEPADIIERAERELIATSTRQIGVGLEPMSSVMTGMFEYVTQLTEGRRTPGLLVGIDELDRITNGLRPGGLSILAARPGQGKTALAMQFAKYVALTSEDPVAYFSIEMDRDELRSRAVVSEANLDHQAFERGDLSDWNMRRIGDAIGLLSDIPLHLDTRPTLTLRDIRVECRRLKARRGRLALVVVDYLQLLTEVMTRGSFTKKREQVIAEFSRGLKALAKELQVHVMALSQLNRSPEARPGGRPQLSDLRESGAIEQDADLVMLLWRPWSHDKTKPRDLVKLAIAKHRNGPPGGVDMRFRSESFRFDDWRDTNPSVTAADLPFTGEA